MKIKWKLGDVCHAEEQIIAHGCNMQGVMGAGVAKKIRAIFPEAYSDYRKSYLNDNLSLGKVIFTPVYKQDFSEAYEIIIANCITQRYYGRVENRQYVDYKAIQTCIRTIDEFCAANDIDSVAMPMIGCSHGGGDWNIISQIIESESYEFEPVVYKIGW